MRTAVTAEQVRRALSGPVAPAWVDGVFAAAPNVRCWLGPVTLGDVCRWSCGPAAWRWVGGQAVCDLAAVATARLNAAVWADAAGTPLGGPGGVDVTRLPAGVVDRLLLASDRATGYLPDPPPSGPPQGLSGYHQPTVVWLRGLFASDRELTVGVRPYDFATLAAAEAAATVRLPEGGEARVEVLAWPVIVAAALCGSDDPAAPPLLTPHEARHLPYGAARSVVEVADRLSELGGPDPGVQFPDHSAGPRLDQLGALAAADDRPLPERAAGAAGGAAVALPRREVQR
ncbi:MAG: hypothetical protein IT204_20195 [Fimbriimonadaceae bacterium]|nr:hypothetical protein [Fimbriimonadaceae bacterium]